MEEVVNKSGENLAELLVGAKIIKSKSEWRRLIDEGAVTELTKNTKITDPYFKPKKGNKFKIGKKRFVQIV